MKLFISGQKFSSNFPRREEKRFKREKVKSVSSVGELKLKNGPV